MPFIVYCKALGQWTNLGFYGRLGKAIRAVKRYVQENKSVTAYVIVQGKEVICMKECPSL